MEIERAIGELVKDAGLNGTQKKLLGDIVAEVRVAERDRCVTAAMEAYQCQAPHPHESDVEAFLEIMIEGLGR